MATTKRGPYRFQIREWCVFYVAVEASSLSEAVEKAKALHEQKRPLAAEYSDNGVYAVLDEHSSRVIRRPFGQSSQAQA